MKPEIYLLRSLDTVFCDECPSGDTLEYTEILRGEAFAFQLALYMRAEETDGFWDNAIEIKADVEAPSGAGVKLYVVENVPVMRVGYRMCDDWFLRKTPGLYPDRLVPCPDGRFTAPSNAARSLYINFNEECEDIPAGEYPINIKIYRRKRANSDPEESLEPLFERQVTVSVADALLPRQRIVATNWLHYDCMAHFSGEEPFSEGFFPVMESYIRLAVKNGQNMILLPAFTPPLDTPVGEERMTVQLVGVEKAHGKYSFDFSMLDRFVKTCLGLGVEYFEHSHLFTQWGAEHAPKIMVREDGEERMMFGWHTDAVGEEYVEFLTEYIAALKRYLSENGYEKRFFFHVSDEPVMSNIESYKKASDLLHSLLGGLPSGDALSDYEFYARGIVETPIVTTDHIGDFIGRAEHVWAYYIGTHSVDNLSNRLIGMPEARGRVLGSELYYHNIEGFLHWGFNAHHNRLSRKLIDPKASSDMGADFVGGTSYLVYPSEDGMSAEPSPRLFSFRDAMQDARAMLLLERLTTGENVRNIIKKHIPDIGFNARVDEERLVSLRREINEGIKLAASGGRGGR